MSRILVTGGSGFIGSGLVKALVHAGHRVRVLDDNSRGVPRRLKMSPKTSNSSPAIFATPRRSRGPRKGMDEVHHLAFVNGTEFFYSQPDLVLDVGVRGMINVIDACRKHNVGNLILASSSEVYQTPPNSPDRRDRPADDPRPAQPALFLRRRQADQRTDGDQFRPQISSSAC